MSIQPLHQTASPISEVSPAKTEAETLRIENHKLKSMIFNLQQQLTGANSRLASLQLMQERELLEKEFGKGIFDEKKK